MEKNEQKDIPQKTECSLEQTQAQQGKAAQDKIQETDQKFNEGMTALKKWHAEEMKKKEEAKKEFEANHSDQVIDTKQEEILQKVRQDRIARQAQREKNQVLREAKQSEFEEQLNEILEEKK